MPEFDSMYGASSKASFDAGKAPKGTSNQGNPFSGGNGQKSSGTTTTKSTKKTINTNNTKNLSLGISVAKNNPLGIAWNILSRPFKKKTEQQKVEANIKKGYDVNNPAEMHAIKPRVYTGNGGNGGGGNVTTVTQSLVTAPTADKSFGHQWDFKAYDNQQGATTSNVYDYAKAPYAKKGKLVRKYATGQEIKNFSKGKRFGPPPLKGPDPQGLQTILENSDYFKKLIG